jgi:hypothetical protein
MILKKYFHKSKTVVDFFILVSVIGENYINYPKFSIHIRLLSEHAFLPTNDVEKAFEELLDSEYYKEHEYFLQLIVNCFEDIWIDRSTLNSDMELL